MSDCDCNCSERLADLERLVYPMLVGRRVSFEVRNPLHSDSCYRDVTGVVTDARVSSDYVHVEGDDGKGHLVRRDSVRLLTGEGEPK